MTISSIRLVSKLCIGCGACESMCGEVFSVYDEVEITESYLYGLDTEKDILEAEENCPVNNIIVITEKSKYFKLRDKDNIMIVQENGNKYGYGAKGIFPLYNKDLENMDIVELSKEEFIKLDSKWRMAQELFK